MTDKDISVLIDAIEKISTTIYSTDSRESLAFLFKNIIDTTKLQKFQSLQQAINQLGENKPFLWAEDNIDGVVSPNGTLIGITKT